MNVLEINKGALSSLVEPLVEQIARDKAPSILKVSKTGWTHSDTVMVKRKDGTQKAVLQTKWTQKGRLGLYELLKQHGIFPLIEQEDETQEA